MKILSENHPYSGFPQRLTRDVVLLMSLKLLLLALLYWACFSPSHSYKTNASNVAERLLSPASSSLSE